MQVSLIGRLKIKFMSLLSDIIELLNKVEEKENNKPKLLNTEAYQLGTFSLLGESVVKEIESLNDQATQFDNAVEIRTSVRNSSNKNMKVTDGVLKVNSVTEIDYDNEGRLTLIPGVEDSKVSFYIVNNTDANFGARHFKFNAFRYYESYPTLSSQEMIEVFQSNEFSVTLPEIPSGYVSKIFEFTISEEGKKKLASSKDSYLFSIKDYRENEENEIMGLSHFDPIVLYIDINNQLRYGYLIQGGGPGNLSGEKTIPNIYLNVNDNYPKAYPININNKVLKQDTTSLIQYLTPDKSCNIKFSLELEVDGKKLKNKESAEKSIQIIVPPYMLKSGHGAYNKRAFETLIKNDINESSKYSVNEFTKKFKYDRSKWVEEHITKL